MVEKYPLPADAAAAFRTNGYRCSNPGLLFDRFTPDLAGTDGGAKKDALAKVRDCPIDGALLMRCVERWRRMVGALNATVFEATTDARLVVGLGRKGPLEVGFAFHRLYGFPVIPGSALKGIARAYALLAEGLDPDSPPVVSVLGHEPVEETPGQAGDAVFFDALPARRPTLELDVMNPHFPDYYREKGRGRPTNWQSPVPVPFLTVARAVPFLFAVGTRSGAAPEVCSRGVAWLRGGLEQLGAGAKTTSGYGYFMASPEEAAVTEPAATKQGQPPQVAQWRRGVIRSHHSARGGLLTDAETGQPLDFGPAAPEPRGITFKTKALVEYQAVEQEGKTVVIAVRKADH